jgi:hypothetical protein
MKENRIISGNFKELEFFAFDYLSDKKKMYAFIDKSTDKDNNQERRKIFFIVFLFLFCIIYVVKCSFLNKEKK